MLTPAYSQSEVKAIWSKLRKDDPELLTNFEMFLENVSGQLRRTQAELTDVEIALQQKATSHDDQVRQLYEEMESQIKAEREKALNAEQERLAQMREEMESALVEKDQQLQEILSKHAEMERKLTELGKINAETEQEKERLAKEREAFAAKKDRMEEQLEEASAVLKEQREQLEAVKRQQREEKRERAKQAFKVTEGIATEREDLVKQLDMLRTVNKELKDARDEKDMGRRLANFAIPPPVQSTNKSAKSLLIQQAEKAHAADVSKSAVTQPTSSHPLGDLDRMDELAPSTIQTLKRERGFEHHSLQHAQLSHESDFEVDDDFISASTHAPLGGAPLLADRGPFIPPSSLFDEIQSAKSRVDEFNPHEHPRGEPVGGNDPQAKERSKRKQSASYHQEDSFPRDSVTPERLFKVVFVGDSGVGKTCFLHRFCHDKFIPTFSATIGVDFQVKSITVDNRMIALQLWDTAGQERFRSITKQYFRKADGVVLMYDVTSELSFINLRNWVMNVKEGVEEDCVLCLVGNKIDLVADENTRTVKYKDGQNLANKQRLAGSRNRQLETQKFRTEPGRQEFSCLLEAIAKFIFWCTQ